MADRPILYSFRRCPYAMRARLAIQVAEITCEVREILLRDKAADFLAVSPKGTVPVLVTEQSLVVDESLDVMIWALEQSDPDHLLEPQGGTYVDMIDLISKAETDFKTHLDRYKYAGRDHPGDGMADRDLAVKYLEGLDGRLGNGGWIFGARRSLADLAIAPFVRQFANVDRIWFDTQPYSSVHKWLSDFLNSDLFAAVMTKYPIWQPGDPITEFPTANVGIPHAS